MLICIDSNTINNRFVENILSAPLQFSCYRENCMLRNLNIHNKYINFIYRINRKFSTPEKNLKNKKQQARRRKQKS